MIDHRQFFTQSAPQSRVWTFMADRALSEEDLNHIHQKTKSFLQHWNAHGDLVHGDYAILYNQFLVMVADESQTTVSGCSTDSMVRFVQTIGNDLQVDFTNRMLIGYLEHDRILISPLAQFKQEVRSGAVAPDTLVFNPAVNNLQEWRANWLQPVSQSWAKNWVSQ